MEVPGGEAARRRADALSAAQRLLSGGEATEQALLGKQGLCDAIASDAALMESLKKALAAFEASSAQLARLKSGAPTASSSSTDGARRTTEELRAKWKSIIEVQPDSMMLSDIRNGPDGNQKMAGLIMNKADMPKANLKMWRAVRKANMFLPYGSRQKANGGSLEGFAVEHSDRLLLYRRLAELLEGATPIPAQMEPVEADAMKLLRLRSGCENTPAPPSRKDACRLRIIAVNDLYELEGLARLKTLVDEELQNSDTNVITTLAGDFLAPYLLSSLDAGHGMVRILNSVPMDLCCFGNHESDIPYTKLTQRIAEFKGVWLNSNMPDFKPSLPAEHMRELRGLDGAPCARKVAFTGFCIGGGKFASTYRDGSFGGAAATMVPVLESAPQAVERIRQQCPDVDEIIPLTHQDMPEDVALAKLGLFPVVVAGHDHEVMLERHGSRGCQVVKAGMNAANAAIIDVVWEAGDAQPKVDIEVRDLSQYKEDPELTEVMEHLNRPVRELESAMLYEIAEGEHLSSLRANYGESAMARKVADGMREVLDCDCAIINSGAVRGKKDYADCPCISYGDLKKECPYPSPIVVTHMTFPVLSEAIRVSRAPWWDKAPDAPNGEATGGLQIDNCAHVDTESHMLTCMNDDENAGDDPDRLYNVACDTRVLKTNKVLIEYCAKFPERIPPDDAGRPVLPILVEYFCGLLWRRLLVGMSGGNRKSTLASDVHSQSASAKAKMLFDVLDANGNGFVCTAELAQLLQASLGSTLCSRIIVEQMVMQMDEDSNGHIDKDEFLKGIIKVFGNLPNHMQ